MEWPYMILVHHTYTLATPRLHRELDRNTVVHIVRNCLHTLKHFCSQECSPSQTAVSSRILNDLFFPWSMIRTSALKLVNRSGSSECIIWMSLFMHKKSKLICQSIFDRNAAMFITARTLFWWGVLQAGVPSELAASWRIISCSLFAGNPTTFFLEFRDTANNVLAPAYDMQAQNTCAAQKASCIM